MVSCGRILQLELPAPIAASLNPILRSTSKLELRVVDTPQAALEQLEHSFFDLLVMDLPPEDPQRLALLHDSRIPALVMTTSPSLAGALCCLRAGAVDYLTPPFEPELLLECLDRGIQRGRALRMLRTAEDQLQTQFELVSALRCALRSSGYGPAQSHANALPRSVAKRLSPRQREVLSAFRELPHTADLAAHLHISTHTVKNHLKAIFRKLEVSSRAELLARLLESQG